MARKLKTYTTNLGFFELAIAAPSMKAALEAWGMSHNAFQHGFAHQTDDADIIAATNEMPGIVLKRAVGTSGAFKVNAELPTKLPNIRPTAVSRAKSKPMQPQSRNSLPDSKQSKAAIISFQKAKAKRDSEREKKELRLAEERAERKRSGEKAEAVFEKAKAAFEKKAAAIERKQEILAAQFKQETERWDSEKDKLERAIDRARK